MLQEQGFAVFCGVGPWPYLETGSDYVLMGRRSFCAASGDEALALVGKTPLLAELFCRQNFLESRESVSCCTNGSNRSAGCLAQWGLC